MNLLTKFLLKEVLDNSKVVAIYGGGFKPPHKGHFAVVKKTLEDFPEIDELKIFVGGGIRDGITQNESIQIWNIYKSLLPNKIDVEPSVAPVKSVLNYAKDHPDEKVYWILGAREGDEDDLKDIENRTVSIGKYPNIEVKVITNPGGVSGTKTRQAIRDNNKEQFFYMIPDVSNEEKEQIWDMTSSVVKEEQLNEEINFNKIKDKLKNIIDAVKQESKETKQAFSLLLKSVKGDIELTDLQKQFIKEQMIDLLKSVGLVTLAVMPAGSLVALLLKALKLSSYVTPSAFMNEIGDASAKVYPFTSDIDPSKLVDIAKKFHETNTSTVYFDTKLVYKFKTDKANYDVRFHVVMERKSYANIARNPNWKPGPPYKTYAAVGFNIEGDTEEKISNLNEQFSVLSTVTKIIFDFIDNVNASGGNLVSLQVAPKSDVDTGSKLDSKRGKFYAAYIKKNLSKLPDYDAKEGKNDKGDEYVEIYKKNSINEADPKKGTGKKPEGSSRRLYTDENPKDTVGIKFKTKEDIVDTLNKTSFKSKPHARQSQVINLIHQRVRAAYGKAKDPEVKARLKRGLDYIESRKEMSKKKTERLRKQKTNENQQTNLDTFDRLEYYKNYFINVSPSTFDIITNNEDIIISGINKPYPKEFNDVEDTKQVPVISENIDSNNLEELVTATQVICDNCGWKWDKEDGGDDLYVCHKCGHDNTPTSDPFGLNELAKQFGKEVGRDLTKGWNPQEDFVSLSKYMIDNGMNIKPLPKIKVIKDDKENASDLLGKTAYYDPSNKSITLYTFGRHPKDILRSFTHEMVHHEQNLNGNLSNITTTNTNEGGDLPEIEKEAYEKGNMMLRNWEDSIKNPIKEYILDIPKFNYPKTFTHRLRESLNEITLSKDNAVKINGKLDGGEFTVGNITYVYSINNIRNPYKDKGNFYNVSFYPKGNITSEPLEGKENYIKILSTMYKIIVDFVEAYKPEYIGIASMDNTGDKNYHTIYAALTDNKYNRIPGYFRKDVSLPFNTPEGKGRFVVLKRKDV